MGYYRNNLIRGYRPDGAADSAVYSENYQYNDANQRNLRTRSVGGNVEYAYDSYGQLQTEATVGGTMKGYAYDLIGNRLNFTDDQYIFSYESNRLNEFSSVMHGGDTYQLTYDSDGNLLTWNGKTFTWDGENRLKSVTVGSNSWEYAYDELNRRTSETFKSNDVVQYVNRFTYDGYNVHTEARYNSSDVLQSWIGYTWGKDLSDTLQGAGGVGGLLWQTTGAGVRAFPFYDGNGNICGYTDVSGVVQTRYLYDGFLNATQTGAASYRYQASTKSWNPALGLLEYQFRAYSPELGRWIQEDPIEENGGINLYGFVRNNPIKYIDYNGSVTISSKIAAMLAAKLAITTTPVGRVVSYAESYFYTHEWRDDEDELSGYIGKFVQDIILHDAKMKAKKAVWESFDLTKVNAADWSYSKYISTSGFLIYSLGSSSEVMLYGKYEGCRAGDMIYFRRAELYYTWYDNIDFKSFYSAWKASDSFPCRLAEGSADIVFDNILSTDFKVEISGGPWYYKPDNGRKISQIK